jgi:uncharacterized protein YbjT (DUF2867 family)
MRLTVFGGTGPTGMLLVPQALIAGHDVTAYVRNPAKLTLWRASSPMPPRSIPPYVVLMWCSASLARHRPEFHVHRMLRARRRSSTLQIQPCRG